jgi:hypothetical protein
MGSEIWTWFAGIGTIGGMAYIITGFFTAYVINFIWCRRKGKPWNVNWRYAGIAIGVVAIMFISMQTQVAYSTAKITAQEVQDCQREFNQALRNRAEISDDNDHWSYIQRTALAGWLHDILLPPADIAELRQNNSNDPRVQQWGIDITTRYSEIVQDAQVKQEQALKARAAHPLPEPTCGR